MLSPVIDTLARRLFLLMWAALVVSHLMAFLAVHAVYFTEPGMGDLHHLPALPTLPTLPSLPPTPGIPDALRSEGGDPLGPPMPTGGHAPQLPQGALILDYGVRVLVIALAAWFGARWVASPVKKLVQASKILGDSVSNAEPLPTLDEKHGPHEVREAASVFNVMAKKLRQQFKERGLFVAAISHDLRTPLTRLRMRVESMDATPEQQRKSVDEIHEMNSLIDTVLEVFRDDGDASAEPMQPTDLAALVQAIADDSVELGHRVECLGQSAVAAVRPMAMRRVVGNLISNAVRYGGSARVKVVHVGRVVHITVDDDGPGIPEDQLDAVFQPFYRLESSRNRDTGGTGLGLYIARDLIERQGGSLTLSNPDSGGLRAEISVPCA